MVSLARWFGRGGVCMHNRVCGRTDEACPVLYITCAMHKFYSGSPDIAATAQAPLVSAAHPCISAPLPTAPWALPALSTKGTFPPSQAFGIAPMTKEGGVKRTGGSACANPVRQTTIQSFRGRRRPRISSRLYSSSPFNFYRKGTVQNNAMLDP